MSKRTSVLVVVGALVLFLVAVGRSWITGRTADPVLGNTVLAVTGSQAVPSAIALSLTVGAALVAMLTGGPRIRSAALVVLVLAAVGAVLLVSLALRDPAAVLGDRAADLSGRTGRADAAATVTGWGWAGLVAALALLGGALATVVSARGWSGPSDRFERTPSADGAPVDSDRRAWDELTAGTDPTRGEPHDPPAART